jgi:hypothetical protein
VEKVIIALKRCVLDIICANFLFWNLCNYVQEQQQQQLCKQQVQ